MPYSYCENGKVKGISVDIFKSIFSNLEDYSLKIKGIEWNKAIEIMKQGRKSKIKMIGTITYKPKDRPFIVDYTKPYAYDHKVIFCNKFKKGTKKWPQDFYHLKIAKMKGFAREKELEQAVANKLIEVEEGDSRENILALLNNKVDCYINDEIATKGEILKLKKYYNDRNISTKKLDKIKEIAEIGKKGFRIGFSSAPFPEKKDLIKKINLAIQVMKNSGEIEEIKQKYLKLYLHPKKKRTINVGLYNSGDNKLVSDKLDGYGVIPEIVSKAFKVEDINVNYQFHEYNYDYLLTKWNKICMSVPWLNIGNRERYFYFSNNIKPTAMYFFYNTEFNSIGSIKNNFEQYRIGGIKGYFYEKDIFDKKKTIQYTSFENWGDLIEALLANKIDVVFARKARFYTYLKNFLPSEQRLIQANDKPIIQLGNYAIFSRRCKDAKELRDKFIIGLKKVKKRGIFTKILKRYNMTIDEFNGLKDNRGL